MGLTINWQWALAKCPQVVERVKVGFVYGQGGRNVKFEIAGMLYLCKVEIAPWVSRKYCTRLGPRKWHHMNKDHNTDLPRCKMVLQACARWGCTKHISIAPSYCLVAVILHQWCYFLGPNRVQYFLLTQGDIYPPNLYNWSHRQSLRCNFFKHQSLQK